MIPREDLVVAKPRILVRTAAAIADYSGGRSWRLPVVSSSTGHVSASVGGRGDGDHSEDPPS